MQFQLFWVLVFLRFVIAKNDSVVYPPSTDPFYSTPDDFDKYKIGDVMRIRETPHDLRSIYLKANIKNSWQVLIKTHDNSGKNATWVVSTIVEPYNANPERLVSYQIAMDSSSPDCAPSYAIQYGASMANVVSQVEFLLIQMLLEEGYYVSIPDYEGPSAAFGVGHVAAYSTLDSIRGVLKTGKTTGIKKDAKVAMWGYSGGSLPTSWSAKFAPSYAPDIKDQLVGAAFGGLLSNLTSTAEHLDGNLFAGFVGAAIGGLSRVYPEIDKAIDDQIRPEFRGRFEQSYKQCVVGVLFDYAEEHLFSGTPDQRWAKDGWDILHRSPIKEILKENELAPNTSEPVPDIPCFLYHGTMDEIVPYENAKQTYETWCKAGIKSFYFASDVLAEHLIAAVTGAPAALQFINDRFDGKKPVDGCKHETFISNAFIPGSKKGLMDIGKTAFASFMGEPIGPSSSNSTSKKN
ncbi:lipase 4 [Diutina catenulata]